MSDVPQDFTAPDVRRRQWSELAKCRAFTEFFIGHELGNKITKLEASLIESCSPEDLKGQRTLRFAMRDLQRAVRKAMEDAINTDLP